jgi:hypothetical protein
VGRFLQGCYFNMNRVLAANDLRRLLDINQRHGLWQASILSFLNDVADPLNGRLFKLLTRSAKVSCFKHGV